MDWNWFHSAVAQSSAAIAGIFGDFIFTKIINNQAQFYARQAMSKSLLQEAKRLREEARNRYYSWYNKMTNKDAIRKLRDTLIAEDEIHTPEYYFYNCGFSLYQSKDAILPDIEILVENARAARKHPHQESSSKLADIGRRSYNIQVPIIDPIPITTKLEAELESIEKIAVSIRSHTRAIKAFALETKKHPESSLLISVSVIFGLALFYVGVVFPLSQLPIITIAEGAPQEQTSMTTKFIILISISIIFTGIMVLFFILNLRLRMKDTDLSVLTRFDKESEYSEYLGHEAENLKLRKEVV